jgi:predicted Fe-Mo cluster-binding NifX family protein
LKKPYAKRRKNKVKVGFPVQANNGFESEVYGHFGSAAMFIVVDTETSQMSVINNGDMHHVHGACNPIKAINGRNVDAIVVGGIGARALSRLNQSGIRVYQAMASTVKENMEMLMNRHLPEFMPQHTCGGHTNGSGCGH